MAPRRRFRGLIFLWALLQLAMPGAATYADALIEHASPGTPVTHVESGTEASCRPVHAADCALCQLVLRVATTSTPPALPTIEVAVPAPSESLVDRPLATARGWLPPTRAPPAV